VDLFVAFVFLFWCIFFIWCWYHFMLHFQVLKLFVDYCIWLVMCRQNWNFADLRGKGGSQMSIIWTVILDLCLGMWWSFFSLNTNFIVLNKYKCLFGSTIVKVLWNLEKRLFFLVDINGKVKTFFRKIVILYPLFILAWNNFDICF
jgi:hypothetical protein